MIARIWRGWTNLPNADKYEELLRMEIFPGIVAKNIDGYKSIQLLRQSHQNEIEFITIMKFESLDAVKQFAGEDYEQSYVPKKARKLLKKFDDHAQHYEIKEYQQY